MSDYISREKAIKSICQYGTAQEKIGRYAVTISELKQTVADTLSDLPSADVRENVHGKWISELELYGEGKWNYQCSVCGRSICLEQNETLDDYPFCHCGADMRGE